MSDITPEMAAAGGDVLRDIMSDHAEALAKKVYVAMEDQRVAPHRVELTDATGYMLLKELRRLRKSLENIGA